MSEATPLKRTPVNPWPWSLQFGYNQAEVLEGGTRQLVCAGQTSVDETGAPQHLDDMRGQIGLALDNLEAVLAGAAMTLADVTKLGVYTTSVDETMKNFDVVGSRFGAHNVTPPMTLLGVSQLALPGLMFEIDATATT